MIHAQRVVSDNIYITIKDDSKALWVDRLPLTIEEAEDLVYVLLRELKKHEDEQRAL